MTSITPLSSLIYTATDTLGIPLYYKRDSKVRAASPVTYSIGKFWEYQTDMLVESDEASAERLSLFVRFSGALWAYMIVTPKGSWLFRFDGEAAKIRPGNLSSVGTGNTSNTMKHLKPFIKGSLEWDMESRAWVPCGYLFGM